MSEIVGVDTNWLIALATDDHPDHQESERLWNGYIDAGDHMGLTPLVVAEFVHVVTDARRFRAPCSMSQALDLAEEWWLSADVERIFPTQASVTLALQWMRQFQLGRKRVLDTQLAATLHLQGIRRILTANPSDYKVFGVFEFLSPDSTAETKE
ncbi:MAG: PIN domain-containing protein [Planctomycetaceae bacterium]|nr:PIN domain-containing protein [Planctomycetaceae bacterium]